MDEGTRPVDRKEVNDNTTGDMITTVFPTTIILVITIIRQFTTTFSIQVYSRSN